MGAQLRKGARLRKAGQLKRDQLGRVEPEEQSTEKACIRLTLLG